MNKAFLVSFLSIAVAVIPGIDSYAGSTHVASDWKGAYVPASVQNDNLKTASHVASSWGEAYAPQKLQDQCSYKGGYVATTYADAYVVQKMNNLDGNDLMNTGS